MVLAAVLRLRAAWGTWLNPDEALHYLIVNQQDPITAYRMSLTNAHPPLFFLLLYFWRLLGSSEVMLRLISVLAGTIAIGLFYKWLSVLTNRSAGLAGAVIFALLPEAIALSAEVRGYAVLFLWLTGCLDYLEQALTHWRLRDLGWFGLFLGLAILTHYSALWFTIALGLYTVVRLVVPYRHSAIVPEDGHSPIRARPATRFVLTWLGTQVGAGAVYGWLYVTHIAKLKGSALAQEATTGWLKDLYFQPGKDRLLLFPIRTTVAAFQFIFASPVAGLVGLAAFGAGLVVLFIKSRRQGAGSRALVLILPFVFSCAGAVLGLFPYGGTRHTSFLAIFAVAGVSILVATLTQRRTWLSVTLAGVLALGMNGIARPPAQSIPRVSQRRSLMLNAIALLRNNAPPGDTIFADYQTSVLLGYYLGGEKAPPFGTPHGQFWEFHYGGYLVVATPTWDFNRKEFRSLCDSLAQTYSFAPGRRLWLVDAGWGVPLVDQREQFGGNIAVVPLRVGVMDATSAGARFARLAQAIDAATGRNVKTVFWPTRFLSAARAPIAGKVVPQVRSYAEVYAQAQQNPNRFSALLPALAFWIYDDPEPHPEFMRYMDEGENYVSGGYRFTLVTQDPDHVAAVYLIEPVGQP